MAIERISDKEWHFLEKLVKENKGLRGRPAVRHRQIFDAIFWVAKHDTPWRALPEDLGKWNTVYRQFSRWCDTKLWDSILEEIDRSGSGEASCENLRKNVMASRLLCLTRRKSDQQDDMGQNYRREHLEAGLLSMYK